jgi:hypothetical protein
MLIKITKSVAHLGFGYRPGFTGDVPEWIAKELIQEGRAVALPPVQKVEEKEVEPKVVKAVIRKSKKR